MPAIVIVGGQRGDEGKGKATDHLGSRVDYVVKFNGGNCAHGEQPHDPVGAELAPAVERRHHGVQAPVAAGDDDPAGAGAVQCTVELAGIAGRGHLDRRRPAEDAERRGERDVVGGAGVTVGDHQERLGRGHRLTLRGG